MNYLRPCVVAACVLVPFSVNAQGTAAACLATATSMTLASWREPARPPQAAPKPGLELVRELPLPGPANRFDYQSVDATTGRIYMNHMNAGRTIGTRSRSIHELISSTCRSRA